METLTQCGITGRLGPTMEQCEKAYNTERFRERELFKMDNYRQDIQLIKGKKLENGQYEVVAYASGNHTKTGSGLIITGKCNWRS